MVRTSFEDLFTEAEEARIDWLFGRGWNWTKDYPDKEYRWDKAYRWDNAVRTITTTDANEAVRVERSLMDLNREGYGK